MHSKFVLSLTFLILPLAVWTQDLRWTVDSRLQAVLDNTSQESRFSWSEAFRTALILEGIPEGRLEEYQSKLEGLFTALLPRLEDPRTLGGKADLLLQILHENTFKKYETLQTRLSVLLDKGTFNCVSSALLYGILATRAGLDVSYVGTRDHAFCVVTLQDRIVDVETTTALGFDPGKKREFLGEFGKVTGVAYVPVSPYARRTPLNFKGILGLLIQNMVAESQHSADVFTPFGLAWDRYTLEGNPESKDFLIQVFKNLAAYRNDRKQYTTALEEASRMRELLGSHSILTDITRSMVNNQLVLLFNQKQWATARDFLMVYKGELGNLVPTWESNLVQGESKEIYTQGGFPAILVWTESRRESMDTFQRLLLEESYLLQTASPLMNQKKWAELTELTRLISPELLMRPKVISLLETLTYNKTVEIHNQFATLMNKRDILGAKLLLESALKDFPESELLKKDWSMIPK